MYTITIVKGVKSTQRLEAEGEETTTEALLPQSFVAQVWNKDPDACKMLAREQAKHHGLEVVSIRDWRHVSSHGLSMESTAYAVKA